MSQSSARWSSASAFLFIVLFGIAIGLVADVPGAGSTDAKILSYYQDHGNQVKLEISYFVCTLAVVALLWFVGFLASQVRSAAPDMPWLGRIVTASGAASGVVMLAGFAASSAVAATADHTSRFHIDPDTARVISDFGYPLTFETGLPLAAPLVLATTLALRRARLIGRWLSWAGFVVSATCVVGFLGVPMALYLLWMLAVAIVLLRRREVMASATAPNV